MTKTGIQWGGVVTFRRPHEMRLRVNKKYKEESVDLRRLKLTRRRNVVSTLLFYTLTRNSSCHIIVTK